MTDLNTTISIGSLADWKLHWLCVDMEFRVKDRDPIDKRLDFLKSVIGRRLQFIQELNIIYDHPTTLIDAIKQLPNWIKLDKLIEEDLKEMEDQVAASARQEFLRKLHH